METNRSLDNQTRDFKGYFSNAVSYRKAIKPPVTPGIRLDQFFKVVTGEPQNVERYDAYQRAKRLYEQDRHYNMTYGDGLKTLASKVLKLW